MTRWQWRWSVGLVSLVAFMAGACARPDAPPAVAVREAMLPLASGDSLWYGVMGSGPDTIVVVPGGPSLGHAYLTALVRPLAAEHAVLLYDPRGRGRSSPLSAASAGVSPMTDAADLEVLLDSLRLLRPAYVAHGYGAVVLGTLARRAPARVRRAVLVAPELGSPTAIYDLSSESMDSVAVKAYAADFRDSLFVRDEAEYCRRHWGFVFAPVEDVRPAVVQALADSACAGRSTTRPTSTEGAAIKTSILTAYGATYTHWDAFTNAPAGILVVQGDADQLHRFWSRIWAASARSGRMVEIRAASGLFPWVEQPAAVGTALRTFLAGEWPASATTVPLELQRAARSGENGAK